MLGLQAKCGGTKLSYTQLSKMEGMLGKTKISFELDLNAIRLKTQNERIEREQGGKHSLGGLKLCSIHQKNYN